VNLLPEDVSLLRRSSRAPRLRPRVAWIAGGVRPFDCEGAGAMRRGAGALAAARARDLGMDLTNPRLTRRPPAETAGEQEAIGGPRPHGARGLPGAAEGVDTKVRPMSKERRVLALWHGPMCPHRASGTGRESRMVADGSAGLCSTGRMGMRLDEKAAGVAAAVAAVKRIGRGAAEGGMVRRCLEQRSTEGEEKNRGG
jgi:hypothetical protein